VRGVGRADALAHQRHFARVLAGVHLPAHQPEALVDEIRVEHVAFAVAADVGKAPGGDGRRDLAAVHAELPRKAAQARHCVEPGTRAKLVLRHDVHQVEMARVIAREVVVEPELPVFVAPVPVARCNDAVDQRTMVEHRQVEPAAVPGDELRRVFFDAVEKAPDELGLVVGRIADRPDANAGRIAHRTGDGDDLLQMKRCEVGAARRAPALLEPVEHAGIVDGVADVMNAPDARDVGHRFNVEDEQRNHPARPHSGSDARSTSLAGGNCIRRGIRPW
jgi:hypothetical protein